MGGRSGVWRPVTVLLRPEAENDALAGTQIAMLTPPAALPPKKPAAGKRDRIPVIVLDAGHGGKDPGAVGANGAMEKDITLRMAKELRALLEATGRYKVILTREEDRLLALRQRIDVARTAEADLFISLHADHIEKSALRGASVYTLSENASDAEAAALAARENKEDPYFADVYELIINGVEIGPGYTELNDPDVQAKHFAHQVGDREEQQKFDEDFVTALKYGMPPAGGLGMGVDRLAIMLTGAESLRDVILFPLMRPVERREMRDQREEERAPDGG